MVNEDIAGRYAKLEPKSSTEAQLAMSKVHISKSWKLPPRSKPVRKQQLNKQLESPTSDEEERKKRQNRDAQRAYRERRTNRIQELEDTVETLQGLVKNWQKRYRALEAEFQDVKKENTSLKRANEDYERENADLKTNLDATAHGGYSLDPMLKDLIENFKPMKAVALKKRKITREKDSSGCGFCSEGTTCVCQELEDDGIETARCTENTESCTKCSDIEQSCIRPKKPKISVTANSDFLALDMEDRPNTMDPDFVPGSCKRCQSDPQSRAFCQAVYGPPKDDKSPNCCDGQGGCSKGSGYIPIGDAYQRVKKFMQRSDQDTVPMKQLTSALRVRGQEVELRSIDDAIRNMDKTVVD